MPKRSGSDNSKFFIEKKICDPFKFEWLTEIVKSDIMPLLKSQKVVDMLKHGNMLDYLDTDDRVKYKICSKGNTQREFPPGKNLNEWRLFLLKRQLRNPSTGILLKMMNVTSKDRCNRIEIADRKKSSKDHKSID